MIDIYPFWSNEQKITKLRLDFPAPAESQLSKATVTFRSVEMNHQPQGPANMGVMFSTIEDAIVRAGYETAFFLDLVNNGGEATSALTLDRLKLPARVSLIPAEDQPTNESPLRTVVKAIVGSDVAMQREVGPLALLNAVVGPFEIKAIHAQQ